MQHMNKWGSGAGMTFPLFFLPDKSAPSACVTLSQLSDKILPLLPSLLSYHLLKINAQKSLFLKDSIITFMKRELMTIRRTCCTAHRVNSFYHSFSLEFSATTF